MSFISYAQNFEDVMLWRALKHIENGFYIDVGANDPIDDSVTKWFYDNGWNGINIEPEDKYFQLLLQDRERDNNLKMALSDRNGLLELYVLETRGWSTLDKNVAEEHLKNGCNYKTEVIEIETLDDIFKKYVNKEVHFLKIDVEGGEKKVLEGYSFNFFRPWIIIVEATKPNSNIDVSKEWEDILLTHQYSYVYFDGINKYYVSNEHIDLLCFFQYPPNVLDDFVSSAQVNLQSQANEAIASAEQAQARVNKANTRAEQAQAQANDAIARTEQLELKANEAWHQCFLVVNSSSWKLTKPLRLVGKMARRFVRGSIAWMTFAPASRPRQISEDLIISLLVKPSNGSIAKKFLLWLVNCFPQLKSKLLLIIQKDLFIDVTHIYKNDLKTGIQRVVRSLQNSFMISNVHNFRVKPVFISYEEGSCRFYYVDSFMHNQKTEVLPIKGDYFLGLDLNSEVINTSKTGLFDRWQDQGVNIGFVVYDILPILHPEWWAEGVDSAHEEWLKVVLRYSNHIFCISQNVKSDIENYIALNSPVLGPNISMHRFTLGADIENSIPSDGIPENAGSVLDALKSRPSFLMVGTIEPRKGHAQTIKAFVELWKLGIDINLVIVGKEGWMVEEVIYTLKNNSELYRRLFWLEGVSDEYLEKIYSTSTCLIAASEGEGFGLPLIEAAQYKLPIIARDIPVFREVAGEGAYYFTNNNDSKSLANSIIDWLNLYAQNAHPQSNHMTWMTWDQSAASLLEILMEKK